MREKIDGETALVIRIGAPTLGLFRTRGSCTLNKDKSSGFGQIKACVHQVLDSPPVSMGCKRNHTSNHDSALRGNRTPGGSSSLQELTIIT